MPALMRPNPVRANLQAGGSPAHRHEVVHSGSDETLENAGRSFANAA